MNNLDKFLNFFRDIDYAGLEGNIKIIFLVLTIFFLAFAVFSFVNAHLIVRKHKLHMLHEHRAAQGVREAHEAPMDQKLAGQWERVQQYANSVRESEWKLAVIEADKFVDDALKAKGFHGETMGERLMLIKPNELLSLQDLWDAHKLRNLLVHDSNYNLTHEQALEAVRGFDRVLRELGML